MFSGPLQRPSRSALCFRYGGHGQDGSAGAGLSAHQDYLKPRAEEERRIAAEEKKKQDEQRRIEKELAEAREDSILK
ncbi:ATP synthase subunit e, mitochondrial isoform X1 [Mesoplodon densirostris]|uniref:ATP synthase subunit e, mitochondrial isoform X1 n=1 Tax=Mesoplodon densirostris TaxID=48708 RepID=UPI0028DB5EC7|nr:ATP synthase subunit e, mitochondrial isoform X1 [Mesoplodon densirostris]